MFSQGLGLRVGDKHKVVGHQPRAFRNAVFLGQGGIDFSQVDNEGILDAKHGIGSFIRIIT